MKRKKIDLEEFLSSASSELPLDEGYLDLVMAEDPSHRMPEQRAGQLSEQLRELQEALQQASKKLANPEQLASFGEFLRLKRLQTEQSVSSYAEALQVPQEYISGLEAHSVPIETIPLEVLRRIWTNVDLEVGTYVSLLRKSGILQESRPQYRGAARFAARDAGAAKQKAQSMKNAFDELLLKAREGATGSSKLEAHLAALSKMME